MQSLALTLLGSFYNFIMALIINTNADIIILPCQGFLEKNILSLLSNQMSKLFDNLERDFIMGREKLGYSTVENNLIILWAMLH